MKKTLRQFSPYSSPIFALLFTILSSVNTGFAQDVHWSQYYNTVNYNSPSQIGLYNGYAYQRAVLAYRNQWQSVPVAYNSAMLAFDRQIKFKGMGGNSLGIGAVLVHDEAGDSQMSLNEVTAQLAYHQAVAKNQWISGGVQIGGAQRRFKTQKLTFDNQFNGDVYDPQLANRENFPLNDFTFLDFGVSAGYAFYKDAHTLIEANAAATHLDEPQQSFFNSEKVRLPRRYAVSVRGQFPISERLDIALSGSSFIQGKQTEILASALFNFTLKEEIFKKIALYGGVGLRFNDAIIPSIGMQYNQWRVGLSYDVNTSNFINASQGNGGFELTVQHLWYRVPPIKKAKACPVY